MGKKEQAFWDFIIRHKLKIFIVVSSLLGFYARLCMRSIVSGDMDFHLISWFTDIQSAGGLKALSQQVGDYNIPYQTLIALMTYLPVYPIYAYKGLSILFDYALGCAVAAGVYEITRSKAKAAVSYVATIMLPAVILNSAAWGQCDSIYTFFMVLSFVFLLRENYVTAFLLFGCSFAFKLQALFFLPFLLFYYVWSKKVSFWHFLLIFVPLIIFSAVALLQGRSFSSLFTIYVDQIAEGNHSIVWNYPSFWLLLVKNLVFDNSDHFVELHVFCLAITIIILGTIMLSLINKKKLNAKALLLIATLMTYTCVLFLPSIHDRYAYSVVILSLFACFLEPRMSLVALGHLILETEMYGSGLEFKEPLPWEVLTLINIACYAGVAYLTLKAVQSSQEYPENLCPVKS